MKTISKGIRNGEVELFRFIFAIFVVMSHIPLDGFFRYGGIAVEFFFLVTGYLTMQSITKAKEMNKPEMGIFHFLFKKIKAFYPELCVATLVAIAVSYACLPITEALQLKAQNTIFNSFLLLRMTGLTPHYIDFNGPTWFLSSMIFALLIVYPLLQKYGTHSLLLLLAIGVAGYLCTDHGRLTSVYKWIGFTREGNLRAFAELLLGAFAYNAVQKLRQFDFVKMSRLLLSVVKYGLFVFILFVALDNKPTYHGALLCATWVFVVILFSGQAYDSCFFCNKVCCFLGKWSLPLYLSHRCYTEALPLAEFSVSMRICICFACALPTSLLVMSLASIIRKYVVFAPLPPTAQGK